MDSLQTAGSRLSSAAAMVAGRSPVKKSVPSNKPISFAKNEILRGLVTDLRPGIVKIHLANKQAVVAKLEGTNEVSIGDVAAFKIMENENGKLTLKKLNSTISAKEAAIQKALEEADLPTTEVNHTIVKELLYHKLPINKDTIHMVLKKTEDFPNADVDSIVYLIKHGIELDEGYLAHLDSYKQFDHRLMQHIEGISKQLASFLKEISLQESTETLLSFASSVFSFLDITPISLSEYLSMISEELDAEITSETEVEAETAVEEEGFLDSSYKEPIEREKDLLLSLTGKEQKQLLKLFASYEVSEDYLQSIKNGQISLRDSIQYLSEAIRHYSTHTPEELTAFKTPFVLSLWEQFADLQREHKELASILSTTDRQELSHALSALPMTEEDRTALISGELTSTRFFSLVSAFVLPEQEAVLRSLFLTEAFGTLLKKEFIGLFSLTPKQLSEEPDAVAMLYHSLTEKMKDLQALPLLSSKTDPSALLGQMEDLEKNLTFMQDFNQLFTYIQLPIQLKEQITHGDLYVYTNKKKLANGQKDISVLLHLDMTHLGPLDIHLSLTGTKVHSKFYVGEKETLRLMQRNVRQLLDALIKKGFEMESEFLESPGKPDILKDLIDRDETTVPIKRYSFDLRA